LLAASVAAEGVNTLLMGWLPILRVPVIATEPSFLMKFTPSASLLLSIAVPPLS
jgi:hypothetical protein